MFLWRISNYATLDGIGGTLQSARWHTKGRPIVYTADHPASALLELLVNVDASLLPDDIQLLKILVPTDVTTVAATPPLNWPHDYSVSREVGDQWLERRNSPLLLVPSAILPDVYNTLINPRHPDAARITIINVQRVPLDTRLR
jgi:RES domain-containing protein